RSAGAARERQLICPGPRETIPATNRRAAGPPARPISAQLGREPSPGERDRRGAGRAERGGCAGPLGPAELGRVTRTGSLLSKKLEKTLHGMVTGSVWLDESHALCMFSLLCLGSIHTSTFSPIICLVFCIIMTLHSDSVLANSKACEMQLFCLTTFYSLGPFCLETSIFLLCNLLDSAVQWTSRQCSPATRARKLGAATPTPLHGDCHLTAARQEMIGDTGMWPEFGRMQNKHLNTASVPAFEL
ncbi:hypothetical protein MC885_020398, partial [Smutsia gigantea]